ncbi:ribonuclease H-like protein, partial [Fragilariopsis cylindrus CCMP1102]
LLGIKSIGVDYGLVRTGIAVTIGFTPQALEVIEEERLEKQRSEVATRVVELARREKVDRIVVGLPLHKNGTEADQTKLTRKFAYDHLAKLSLRILGPDVPIFLWDERYTSKEAAARIRSRASDNGGNSGDLYGCLDAESAIIILEHYYEENHQQYNTQYLNVDVEDDN